MAKIEERVEELIKDKIENIGYDLYDVEYAKEGPNYYLRIFIDSEKGIDLNDCEKVSNEINEKLDEADYIKEQYFLEVSSPGAEMELRNHEEVMEAVGKYININTGDKVYEGTMISFENDIVVIRVNLKGRFKNFEVPYESIKKIRLAVKF